MGATHGRHLLGVVGFFETPTKLIDATRKVREANYRSFDAFTPYAVHGLEEAQGLKRSPLPYVTFFAGLTGFICAFALQYWTSVIDWPINVGGKPFNSWPAFVPVMFELTVLFAGIATVVGMIVLNRLPNTRQKIVDTSVTRDKFAILIEGPPDAEHAWEVEGLEDGYKKFDAPEAEQLLKKAGASSVQKVYQEGWF